MIPKSWLESLVIWVNVAIVVITGVVQIVQAIAGFLSPEANVILLQIVTGLTTVLNVLMRFKTEKPIVLTTPATARAMRV